MLDGRSAQAEICAKRRAWRISLGKGTVPKPCEIYTSRLGRRTPKRYTLGQKELVMALIRSGNSTREIGKYLGIPNSTIRCWKHKDTLETQTGMQTRRVEVLSGSLGDLRNSIRASIKRPMAGSQHDIIDLTES
jgi:DNA-binding CsgD family transcriptional regulator